MAYLLEPVIFYVISFLWISQLADAFAIASWVTELGPQVVAQSDWSGKLSYSMCNSTGTPTFSAEDRNLDTGPFTPRNGTSIAGCGWIWEGTTTWASVFYQSTNNTIILGLYECDDNGFFMPNGTWDIFSGTSAPAIHPRSGLSSALYVDGEDTDFRIFYQGMDQSVHMLGASQGNFSYYGPVSQDKNTLGTFAIGSGLLSPTDILVVTAKDTNNLELATVNRNNSRIETIPQPLEIPSGQSNITQNTTAEDFRMNETAVISWELPGWQGDAEALGVVVTNSGRSIFYIGDDRCVYEISDVNGSWHVLSKPDTRFVPPADKHSSWISVTNNIYNDPDEIWMYYISSDALIQAHMSATGVWDRWVTLGADPLTKASSGSVLSSGAKAGIGIVSALAGVFVLLVAGFIIQRAVGRKTNVESDGDGDDKAQTVELDSIPKAEMAGQGCVLEMVGREENLAHEMFSPTWYHELDDAQFLVEMGEPRDVYEMPGDSGTRSTRPHVSG